MIPIPPQQQPSHQRPGVGTRQDGWDDTEQCDSIEGGARFGKRKSRSSSGDDFEAIERASTQDGNEDNDEYDEKKVSLGRVASREIKRTASNTLSKVASRLTTRSLAEPPPPPDGGWEAWIQVAMGWLVLFTTWGYTNSFGSFQTYYTQTLPQSASTISWIGSVQVWLTFFIGAFSGRLLDAGLFVPTFVVGAVLQLLGIFMMSISTRYWHLMLTQGVLTGLGGGIFFCPSIGLIATYFSKRRALAIGVATTGNAAGGLVYPLVVRELIPQIGFAWTTRVLGFINLGCLALVFAFMRPRLPPRASGPIIDWKAFKEPVYVFFVAGMFFFVWAIYYTFYYLASFGIESLDLSFSSASILLIILNGVGIIARLIPPLFADRIGPLNVLIPVLCILSITAYCWAAVDSVIGFYVFTCFYGIFSAAVQCLIPTTAASLTKDLDMVGTRLGMVFSCMSFAALTGPPLGGAIQASSGGRYIGAQMWAATSIFVCFLLLLTARVLNVGWGWKARC
ncbi:MFS general substrate transporter [Polychaeton citri CBS 116435]|uniref:MFS general substrate transporter n=1 Tax=Polychaeton citri CBS 116435 TaxID=1314669 RepID=A0A9P4Q0E4_9PEZI|nr:MFS general substrate transporter [Polychaeton citri CBS 116435]